MSVAYCAHEESPGTPSLVSEELVEEKMDDCYVKTQRKSAMCRKVLKTGMGVVGEEALICSFADFLNANTPTWLMSHFQKTPCGDGTGVFNQCLQSGGDSLAALDERPAPGAEPLGATLICQK